MEVTKEKKKKQMEILKLKNTIKKVKTHWLAQSYQVEMTEDGNLWTQGKIHRIPQLNEREKRLEMNSGESLRDQWDNNKRPTLTPLEQRQEGRQAGDWKQYLNNGWKLLKFGERQIPTDQEDE